MAIYIAGGRMSHPMADRFPLPDMRDNARSAGAAAAGFSRLSILSAFCGAFDCGGSAVHSWQTVGWSMEMCCRCVFRRDSLCQYVAVCFTPFPASRCLSFALQSVGRQLQKMRSHRVICDCAFCELSDPGKLPQFGGDIGLFPALVAYAEVALGGGGGVDGSA